jgi:hypothetical protein
MDRFESGELIKGLSVLRDVVYDDKFGRRLTALKRAVTLVERQPDLKWWRTWVRDTVLEADVALRLSRQQLLALIRLYDDPLTGLREIVPMFVGQPFTQPLAILLQVLDSFASDRSSEVRNYCLSTVEQVGLLDDPVLKIAVKHLRN